MYVHFFETTWNISNPSKNQKWLKLLSDSSQIITKTRLFKYIEYFTTKKNENFQIKNSDIFLISAQNIDCGYSLEPPHRGGSNEYPQPMFLSRNKKNNVYPCKPQFYYIKWGLRGSKLYRYVFVMYTMLFWIIITGEQYRRWSECLGVIRLSMYMAEVECADIINLTVCLWHYMYLLFV